MVHGSAVDFLGLFREPIVIGCDGPEQEKMPVPAVLEVSNECRRLAVEQRLYSGSCVAQGCSGELESQTEIRLR